MGYTLATYASSDGSNARPSQRRLAEQCGIGERAVRTHLRRLREVGLIYRVHHGSNAGRANYADVYQLTRPDLSRVDLIDLPDPVDNSPP